MSSDPAAPEPPADGAHSAAAPIAPTKSTAPIALGETAAPPAEPIAPGEPAAVAAEPPPPLPPSVGLQARLAAVLVGAMALAVLFAPRGVTISPAAPAVELVAPSGEAASLASQLAPVTLLHFWATWCPPCVEEAPALARLGRDYSSYGDFRLLQVAVADSPARVASFFGGAPGAAAVLYDPRWEAAHRFGTEQLPETYLVVAGRVVERFIGEVDWDDPAVRRKIALHLGSSPAAGPAPARTPAGGTSGGV